MFLWKFQWASALFRCGILLGPDSFFRDILSSLSSFTSISLCGGPLFTTSGRVNNPLHVPVAE